MKNLLLIIAIGSTIFIACNDTKDPPDEGNAPASTDQEAPATSH